MQRRKFIADACVACALIAGGGILSAMLQSCSGLPRISAKGSSYSFDRSAFRENNVLVIQRNDAEFDALVVKNENGTFHTLEMKCSHQNQPLTANRENLYCSSHGSIFSLSGEVKVEPAIEPLHRFRTEINGELITIHFNT